MSCSFPKSILPESPRFSGSIFGGQVNLHPGQNVTFFSPLLGGLPGRIHSIEETPVTNLEYPALASTNGGELPVTMTKDGVLQLHDAFYRVEMRLENQPSLRRFCQSGRIWVESARRHSYLADALRHLARVGQRESAF